jgi:hypothetical protein
VDPVPDPTILRKYGSAGNRTWTSGSVDQELLSLDQAKSVDGDNEAQRHLYFIGNSLNLLRRSKEMLG